MLHSIPEENNPREKINFLSLLQSQNYDEIKRYKDKWTDDLFTPNDRSIYSGKTDFSKNQVAELPKFLKVKQFFN
jgi:hypothetical protein